MKDWKTAQATDRSKGRLGQQMDSLDIMDKFYERNIRIWKHDCIGCTMKSKVWKQHRGSKEPLVKYPATENIRRKRYQFLLYFDKLYDKFTDLEKKEFLNSFVEQVDIYEQEQPDGRFLKHIKFRFPVYFGDRETQELCWDKEKYR